jgi:hypothetical protein
VSRFSIDKETNSFSFLLHAILAKREKKGASCNCSVAILNGQDTGGTSQVYTKVSSTKSLKSRPCELLDVISVAIVIDSAGLIVGLPVHWLRKRAFLQVLLSTAI